MRPSILHIIDPASPGGGACTLRLLASLVAAQDAFEHRVVLVGARRHLDLARRCGLEPGAWLCPPRMLPYGGRRDLARLIAALEAADTRIGVIHAWTLRSLALATLVAPSIPRIASVHVGPMPAFASRYVSRVLARRPATILAASAASGRECRGLGLDPSRIALMPPALDPTVGPTAARRAVRERWRAQEGVDESTFVIGLLSEPIRWTDVRAAATSLARVALSGRKVKLLAHWAAGKRIEAEVFLKRIGMSDLLIFDDGAAEPWQIVHGLDAVLAPGIKSGRPAGSVLPLLWAMSARVPVIAERSAAAQQFIDDGVNGLLIDPLDVNAASDRIVGLYDCRELGRRLGDAARSLIDDMYDMPSYAVRLSHAYELLLAGRGHWSAMPRSGAVLPQILQKSAS